MSAATLPTTTTLPANPPPAPPPPRPARPYGNKRTIALGPPPPAPKICTLGDAARILAHLGCTDPVAWLARELAWSPADVREALPCEVVREGCKAVVQKVAERAEAARLRLEVLLAPVPREAGAAEEGEGEGEEGDDENSEGGVP